MNSERQEFLRRISCRLTAALLCTLCIILSGASFGNVQAEAKTTAASKKTAAAKKKTTIKWKKKNKYFYCYLNGKKLKGFRKVNGKYYYFTNTGRQRTGWRKISGKYRYFQIHNGRTGYMVKNKTVNGVRINKKGIAVVNENTENKLSLLVRFQELADQLVRPGISKKKKLVTVFKYARDKNYRSIGSPSADGRWDERLAEAFLNANWADCTMAATGFAYLANAVGYTNVSVRLYGHGHCEINRLIYDPGFAKTVEDDEYTTYFAKTYEQLAAWGTGDDIPIRFI